VRVDGQDVLDVYVAARDAVERARNGDGPSLVESVSLRWRGHAGHDPAKYVPKEMLEEYMQYKDPVKRFQELLSKEGVLDDEAVAELDDRIKREFDEGYAFAQQSPLPEPADVTAGVFADDGYWSREPGRGGGTA
jgi:TPP-dependent pyruvate/acetoin dehydrogenase alpha subunit